jgi:hypothetical protein
MRKLKEIAIGLGALAAGSWVVSLNTPAAPPPTPGEGAAAAGRAVIGQMLGLPAGAVRVGGIETNAAAGTVTLSGIAGRDVHFRFVLTPLPCPPAQRAEPACWAFADGALRNLATGQPLSPAGARLVAAAAPQRP